MKIWCFVRNYHSDFQVGDLVTWKDQEHRIAHRMKQGVVIGFKKFHDWDLGREIKTTAVTVYWNTGDTTNSHAAVLEKL